MNAKTMLAVVAIATGLVSHAADYTFTGGGGSGDISAAANWGGTLPGSGDTATIDGSTAGRSDFTRSGSFGVGAFSLLNWTNAMLLDLNEETISASTLTVGGAGPVVVSNGTLSVSGKVTVNASSVLTVAKGATISNPTGAVVKNDGFAVGNNGKLVIDGGTYNVPYENASSYTTGNSLGTSGNPGYLEIKNGGSFVAPNAGRVQVTTFKGSRITVTDNSTFDISRGNNYNYGLITGNGNNVYAVTNSVFKWFKWDVGGNGQIGIGASNGRFTFHNSTVASSIPFTDTNFGITFRNGSGTIATDCQFLLDGVESKSTFTVKFDGTGNAITVKDGDHAGPIQLQNGSGNSFTLDGATYTNGCSVSLNGGTENAFCVKNGTKISNSLKPSFGGVSNRLEISGSTFGARSQTLDYVFNGEAFQYKLTSHAEGHIGQWGNKPAMTFGSAAKDTLISIDDSTLVTEGYVDLSDATLPTGIAFEFRGAAPLWTPTFWQTCRRNIITLGAADAANKDRVPRFRFVLPETPYAQAPISIESLGSFGVMLNPTAKLEFDFSQMGKALKSRVYPLISGACRSFSDYSVQPLTQELVDQIAANSNLPEGCSLIYSNWVLSLKVRGEGGIIIVVR